MFADKLKVVASGDYLHTRGNATLAELGFGVYELAARAVDLRMLASAPQTDAVRAADLENADALLMLGQYLPASSIAPVADRLIVVARAGVGVDKIDVPSCTQHGVLLFNVPDALTEGTAAGALALIFAISRKLPTLDRLTRAGKWDDRQYHRAREIYGKVLGIIGPGRIGAELIRLVAPFRMRPLAYSPRLTSEHAVKIGAEAATLDRLLSESDFVIVCAPLTEETHGMLGAREIALMKPEAFIVNVGRGPIIDQAALTEALQQERIAGAALDVFTTQPLAADDPLTALDNVVLCPHAVCDTYELRRDVLAVTTGELLDFTMGKFPHHVVNPEVIGTSRFEKKRQALLSRFNN